MLLLRVHLRLGRDGPARPEAHPDPLSAGGRCLLPRGQLRHVLRRDHRPLLRREVRDVRGVRHRVPLLGRDVSHRH